ncbi:NAD(P)/FAD-dependent oxidoreductase [Psychromarinibacter halotolerans]|uniref:NAD(P)/FAD-dependent oxidoreductase n=1 Tax=Psychromarinibacter halotolerans TaxID=1775175 RepID=A0ABV7GVS2_9RHOB|nr:FAD-dependent monooxygenase [Psychromarinibacter halotolerans]MDF0597612.1 FAD-dependent monooxygenase [Psychromarinibacter halotolerans]
MQKINEQSVIVIGAGVGGLASAKALSTMFGKVLIIDRDTMPDGAEPRVGVPQSRQVHVLLGGGLRALNTLVPGFEDKLVAAGANRARVGSEIRVEVPGLPVLPERPFEFHSMCMTRPLLESVLRREVLATPNVELLEQANVMELLASEDGSRVVAVKVLRRSGEEEVHKADFFVDAASRADLTPKLLDKLDMPRPVDTEIGIDLNYSTAVFDIPAEATGPWKAVIHRPDPADGRAGFLFPIENGKWHVNLNSVHGDGAGRTPEEFLEFAYSLRTHTIYDALKAGTIDGKINKFILKASSRRRYEDLDRFPGRLIVIGDAICRYNPAYGQGMSVASQEAAALREVFAERLALDNPLDGIAPDYFQRMATILGAPWSVAESDFVYPETRGERSPDVMERMRVNKTLLRLAYDDPKMHHLWAEVTNLIKPATTLLEDPWREILSQDAPPLPPEAEALVPRRRAAE